MGLLVRRSNDLPPARDYDAWLATTGTKVGLDPARKLPHLAGRLEESYDACRDLCWEIGAKLAQDRGATIARTPTVGAYGTDLRLMLAWIRLAETLATSERINLMVCDDPWLFRQIATVATVDTGAPPPLWPAVMRKRVRGVLSRAKVGLRVALAARATRHFRSGHELGDRVLLVYAHPQSNAQGRDGYFGNLMARFRGAKRLLHTDCPVERARELCADGRTAALHGWGSPIFALGAVFARWKPDREHFDGSYGWLVRRAMEEENSGGGPAMTRWQIHCQDRWLRAVAPRRVVWPWENFAWERELCRSARRCGVATVGYQHTVVGRHQINFAPATNPDGLSSIPDMILCDGPAYLGELKSWNIPTDRLRIGGALRIDRCEGRLYDPDAPVFIPLSGLRAVARQQLEVARMVAASGWRVLVKEHPMYPIGFKETDTLRRTDVPLNGHDKLSAVIFSTGTTGLEGVLAGVPTFRLMPDDRIAVDVMPEGIKIPGVTSEDVVECLATAPPPSPPPRWEDVFSPVDIEAWRALFDEPDAPCRRGAA